MSSSNALFPLFTIFIILSSVEGMHILAPHSYRSCCKESKKDAIAFVATLLSEPLRRSTHCEAGLVRLLADCVSLLLLLHRQHSSISRHCLPFDVFAFFILSSKCMLILLVIVTSGLSNATLDAIFSQAIDSSRCSLVVTLLLLFVHFSGKVVKGVGVVVDDHFSVESSRCPLCQGLYFHQFICLMHLAGVFFVGIFFSLCFC